MLFPDKYTRPVLQGIVEASANGWNAGCDPSGSAPGSGPDVCITGGGAGAAKGDFNGAIYTHSNRSSHLLDPEDVGEGL